MPNSRIEEAKFQNMLINISQKEIAKRVNALSVACELSSIDNFLKDTYFIIHTISENDPSISVKESAFSYLTKIPFQINISDFSKKDLNVMAVRCPKGHLNFYSYNEIYISEPLGLYALKGAKNKPIEFIYLTCRNCGCTFSIQIDYERE